MLNDSFKPIKNYEDYLINENGDVFSKKSNKLLKPRDNGHGYQNVILCKSGKYKNFYIHRLVAQAFLNNPENLPQINHINGVKTDNRVENLEWVSASQNLKHAYDHGLKENCREAARRLGKINGKITGKIYGKKVGKIYGKINCKYAHEANIRHLTPELKELFDDIFINKLKNKDICNKYNLKSSYVSMIKSKQRLQTAFHEYEKLYLFHTQK